MSSTKSLRVGSADAMRRDARKRHDAKLSPAYYRVPRDSDGEEETKIAPERQLSQEDVESIPSLASRFVPKPGPSVEYMMCFHIQRGEGDVVAPGGAYPPFLAANYPEPSIDHSRLNFDEKCRTIAQFLFPSKMRYVTGQELSESRGTLGTLSKPYSFMFVGTDSDYSKFYSHCCVVHVPVVGHANIFEPVAIVAMTFQPTHCSIRRVLETHMQTSTADSIAALRGPEGAAALRTIFDEFLPTTRRYHGFTWVISHRDLLALRSSNQGAKLTQEQKLPLYKCLFTNHKIDTNTTPLSFAGPVIQLDGLLGFLARQLLQRRKGASVTIPKVLQSTRDSDPYEKSILQEQIELYLLFSNADAKAAVEEFSSKTLVQALIDACQDENSPTVLSDTLLPTEVEPHRPKPDPACYTSLLQLAVSSQQQDSATFTSLPFAQRAQVVAGAQFDPYSRPALANYISNDLGRRVEAQLTSVGAVLLAASQHSASNIYAELQAPTPDGNGVGGPIERLLASIYDILAPAIAVKKNPLSVLHLQLETRLDRNPSAICRTLRGKLIQHIQFHQALPVDFANGDWAIRETLQAVEDIQRDEAETGGIPRFASLSAMAALASKYLQRSLPKEDFKAQLLHLEVCPALADIVLRLLQNCGPIVLPSVLTTAADAFKDVPPGAARDPALDQVIVTFFRSPGLPPGSRRTLHLFLKILHAGLDCCTNQSQNKCDDVTETHAEWLADALIRGSRTAQRRAVRAGCFDDSPPGLRHAFAVLEVQRALRRQNVKEQFESNTGASGPDHVDEVYRSVASFMAYVLRHFAALREGRFLDVPEAFDGPVPTTNPTATTVPNLPEVVEPKAEEEVSQTSSAGEGGADTETANAEPDGDAAVVDEATAAGGESAQTENVHEDVAASGEDVTNADKASVDTDSAPSAGTTLETSVAVEAPLSYASDEDGVVDESEREKLAAELLQFIVHACVSIESALLARLVLRSSWDILPSMLPDATRNATFRPNLLKHFGTIDSMAIGVHSIRAKMLSTSVHQSHRGGAHSGDAGSQRAHGIQLVFAGKILIYYPAIEAVLKYLLRALEYLPIEQINKFWILGGAPEAESVLVGGPNDLPPLKTACKRFEDLCEQICLLLAADPRKDISDALDEAGPVVAMSALLSLCSGLLPKWYRKGVSLPKMRGNFKRSLIPNDLLRYCCPDRFMEKATKHQLKKFPSVFGSSKASLRGSATNASGADNQHAHTVKLDTEENGVHALNSTLPPDNGGHGPLTDCVFSFTPPQVGSKDASKACLYNKVVLRRIVELIARLDMQAKLSQDDLVDIIVAMVPALIEPDSSSTNESVAVTFVYHLVREFQRECAMAQYLLQETTHISSETLAHLKGDGGRDSPSVSPKAGLVHNGAAIARTHSMLGKDQPFCPAPLEPFDVEYRELFSRLSPDVLTILASALLTETSVVLIASHPQPLTDVFEAAQALVAPYEWQCFYVPILRGDMVDAMLGAPFAKLLGWVKTKEIVNPVTYFDDCDYTGILIDLDSGQLHSYPTSPVPRPVPNSTFTVLRVPDSVMPCLPDRFGLRVFQDLMGITLGGTLRTVALENSSDAEAVVFLRKNEASRFKEVQWTFTSVLVSLFKNLRQYITVNNEKKSKFNQAAFLASFKQDHQVLMRKIVESQAFECFKASLMTHAGGPFDWWCYTKVKMLRDRYVNKKTKCLNGFLWKAPRGTAPGSAKKSAFKLRYFELGFGPGGGSNKRRSSQKDPVENDAVEFLHYYELTPTLKHLHDIGQKYIYSAAAASSKSDGKGSAASPSYEKDVDFQSLKWTYENGMQKYLSAGIHAFEAQGAPGILFGAGRAGPPLDANKYHKGSFVLERGNGRVSIPQVLASNSTNTPSPFPFVISNVGGKNDAGRKKTDSVVVLCAPTNDIRRKWMEYLKSHMVDSEFMTKLEESYTKAKDFIVDESLQEEIDKGRRERAAWAQKNTGAATL